MSATVAGQSAAQQLGTLELATFQNPAGLRPLGGNLFAATTVSGEPQVGAPGTDGRGTLQQGFLEDSNVSVVEEMINMILGQRAYEANSQGHQGRRRNAVAGQQPGAVMLITLLLALFAKMAMNGRSDDHVREAITAAVRDRMGAAAAVTIDELAIDGEIAGNVQAIPEPGSKLDRAMRFTLRSLGNPRVARPFGDRARAGRRCRHAHANRNLDRGAEINASDVTVVDARHRNRRSSRASDRRGRGRRADRFARSRRTPASPRHRLPPCRRSAAVTTSSPSRASATSRPAPRSRPPRTATPDP